MTDAHPVAILEDAFLAIFADLEAMIPALSDADLNTPTGCPGWDVRDNLAHILALERVILGDADEAITGGVVAPAAPHVRDDFGRYTEDQVHARRAWSRADLEAELGETATRRRDQMATWDRDGEVSTPLGGTAAAAKFLPIRIFDAWAHVQDIRRAVARPGLRTGPAADVAINRVARGFAYDWSGAIASDESPASGIVALRLTGEGACTFTIDLAARIATSGEPDAADVTLTGDLVEVAAWACGRSDAPDPTTFATSGDRALVEAITARGGFTP